MIWNLLPELRNTTPGLRNMGALRISTCVLILAIITQTYATPRQRQRGCQRIPRRSICSGMGYDETIFPNLIEHENIRDAESALELLLGGIASVTGTGDDCYHLLKTFMCQLHIPKCLGPAAVSLPPCREMCTLVFERCGSVMSSIPQLRVVDCDVLRYSSGNKTIQNCAPLSQEYEESVCCPRPFKNIGGACVKALQSARPYKSSVKNCESEGATLAKFAPTSEIFSFLQEELFDSAELVWMGIDVESDRLVWTFDGSPLGPEYLRTEALAALAEGSSTRRVCFALQSNGDLVTADCRGTDAPGLCQLSNECPYGISERFCEALEDPVCSAHYTDTLMPNAFGQTSQLEASMGLNEFQPLILLECSPHLEEFLCGMFYPLCQGGVGLMPCRDLCESVRSGCEPYVNYIGREWPEELDCSSMPWFNNTEILCFGENMALQSEPHPGPEPEPEPATSSTAQPPPALKKRRYDIVNQGMQDKFQGWADVQGQGAANDYCRVLKFRKKRFYLACALAGSDDEEGYTSPDIRSGDFDEGFKNTWYMKDEDGDGRDDFCRCVDRDGSTYVSCMRAGESGFEGHYDFTPTVSVTPRNCAKIRVNPFLGHPQDF